MGFCVGRSKTFQAAVFCSLYNLSSWVDPQRYYSNQSVEADKGLTVFNTGVCGEVEIITLELSLDIVGIPADQKLDRLVY